MVEAAGRVWLALSAPETGVEVFTLGRTAVAAEAPPAAAWLALGAPAPNPSAGRRALALASEAPVTVEAFDALGRRVARLHDGPATGAPLTFDTSGLPAGVYVVRARSAEASASRRAVVR